jgi:kynurenine formamidase
VFLAGLTSGCAVAERVSNFLSSGVSPSIQVVDLSHQLTTFEAKQAAGKNGRFAADLSKPVGKSQAVAAFADQMIIAPSPAVSTSEGVFKLNTTVLPENLGTSIDAGGHFVANEPAVADPDMRGLADLTVEDLVGPAVLIDISARVEAELRKNDGIPGTADKTDFSAASGNVVTAADIEAVADKIVDRAYVIAHTGWSKFYWSSGPGLQGPYINGFNYPGFSFDAVQKLIEIEETRGIKINGLGADNVSVDAFENADWTQSSPPTFAAHLYGLQRGWKMLENLTNTHELKNKNCVLFVGAVNHVGGVAGWARIFARCVP